MQKSYDVERINYETRTKIKRSSVSHIGWTAYKEGSTELNFLAIIAVIFSFIFSYFTIALFLNFIKKFSLNIFIIYRILLSLFILAVVYL